MVDTMKELSVVARKLNQESDKINSLIETINQKLAALNLGLEVWLENNPVEVGDCSTLKYGQVAARPPIIDNTRQSITTGVVSFGVEQAFPRETPKTFLGYCRLDEGGWGLAIKEALLFEDWDAESQQTTEQYRDATYTPLLRASRELRIKALDLVPSLLDCLKTKAEETLRSIERAEQAARNL